jgi:hypothetical protein
VSLARENARKLCGAALRVICGGHPRCFVKSRRNTCTFQPSPWSLLRRRAWRRSQTTTPPGGVRCCRTHPPCRSCRDRRRGVALGLVVRRAAWCAGSKRHRVRHRSGCAHRFNVLSPRPGAARVAGAAPRVRHRIRQRAVPNKELLCYGRRTRREAPVKSKRAGEFRNELDRSGCCTCANSAARHGVHGTYVLRVSQIPPPCLPIQD